MHHGVAAIHRLGKSFCIENGTVNKLHVETVQSSGIAGGKIVYDRNGTDALVVAQPAADIGPYETGSPVTKTLRGSSVYPQIHLRNPRVFRLGHPLRRACDSNREPAGSP